MVLLKNDTKLTPSLLYFVLVEESQPLVRKLIGVHVFSTPQPPLVGQGTGIGQTPSGRLFHRWRADA